MRKTNILKRLPNIFGKKSTILTQRGGYFTLYEPLTKLLKNLAFTENSRYAGQKMIRTLFLSLYMSFDL
jgi:hypothetical protein